MERTITLPLLDAFRFLVCAVRYAIGRNSIAVGWTREQARSIAPYLTSFERNVIIDSIEENFHLIPQRERREWHELLDWLKVESNFPPAIQNDRATRSLKNKKKRKQKRVF